MSLSLSRYEDFTSEELEREQYLDHISGKTKEYIAAFDAREAAEKVFNEALEANAENLDEVRKTYWDSQTAFDEQWTLYFIVEQQSFEDDHKDDDDDNHNYVEEGMPNTLARQLDLQHRAEGI